MIKLPGTIEPRLLSFLVSCSVTAILLIATILIYATGVAGSGWSLLIIAVFLVPFLVSLRVSFMLFRRYKKPEADSLPPPSPTPYTVAPTAGPHDAPLDKDHTATVG